MVYRAICANGAEWTDLDWMSALGGIAKIYPDAEVEVSALGNGTVCTGADGLPVAVLFADAPRLVKFTKFRPTHIIRTGASATPVRKCQLSDRNHDNDTGAEQYALYTEVEWYSRDEPLWTYGAHGLRYEGSTAHVHEDTTLEPISPTPIVHARVLRYGGHAYSPGWTGKRVYADSKDRAGNVLLVCSKRLDDVFAESGHMGWVDLKSQSSRDAKCVTCPSCAERIRKAGFKYAPAPVNAFEAERFYTLAEHCAADHIRQGWRGDGAEYDLGVYHGDREALEAELGRRPTAEDLKTFERDIREALTWQSAEYLPPNSRR